MYIHIWATVAASQSAPLRGANYPYSVHIWVIIRDSTTFVTWKPKCKLFQITTENIPNNCRIYTPMKVCIILHMSELQSCLPFLILNIDIKCESWSN